MTFRSRIVITGGRYEGDLAAKIARLSQFRPIDLTGKTDIGQLGAILKQTRLMVAGDTGVLHLAMAMKVPVVGIYGSTHVSRTGPWGPKEQFLAVGSERHRQRITVEEVFDAVKSLLGSNATPR
jgi:heptosyltransferase I